MFKEKKLDISASSCKYSSILVNAVIQFNGALYIKEKKLTMERRKASDCRMLTLFMPNSQFDFTETYSSIQLWPSSALDWLCMYRLWGEQFNTTLTKISLAF